MGGLGDGGIKDGVGVVGVTGTGGKDGDNTGGPAGSNLP